MRFCIIFAILVLGTIAEIDFNESKEGLLQQLSRAYARNKASLHESDLVLSNPHMKKFEKKYFVDKQLPSKIQLDNLNTRMDAMRKNIKDAFPFAGYSSLDTNLFNRFAKEDVESEKIRKIGDLLDEASRLRDRNFTQYSAVNPVEVAAVKLRINKIDKAMNNNFLDLQHTPAIARPYEDGKDTFNKLQKRIQDLYDNINTPLSAPKPTDEEIAVLRRLNEKMDTIANRLKSLPDAGMEDHILIQAQMLSGLTDLIRRMANAVDDEKREAFLYQVHNLLHFHNLQDQPYIRDFEMDIARSIVSGKRMGNKFERARYDALKQRNIEEAKIARMIASHMKQYGNELVNNAKEMRSREEMMERQQSMPPYQQELLQQHLKNRILA